MKIILAFVLIGYNYGAVLYSQTWSRRADFPFLRYYAIAFSIDNIGYAGLGASPTKLERDFWRYDPLIDVWTQLDSFPADGRAGAISFVINNKAYVGGGETNEGLSRKDLWEFDPSINKWTQKADIPVNLVSESNMVGFSIGSYGYVKASYNHKDFIRYDPGTDRWDTLVNYPGGWVLDQVGFSVNNKGYIGSGFKQIKNTSEFWEYDPTTGEWGKIADLPGTARSSAVAFTIDDFGFVGLGNASGTFPKDFWRYNPQNDTWTLIDSCGYGVMNAFAFATDKKGYVGTGIFSSAGEFWEYTPILNIVDVPENRMVVTLYPNPVSMSLKYETNINNITEVLILDIYGGIIRHCKETEAEIDVSSLPNGVYFLKLRTPKKVINIKFIKK